MAASAVSHSDKVVLVGDFGVGKTTIFTRFKTGAAKDVTLNTRKECECQKDLMVDGKKVSVTLYDTAGMERFEGTIPPTYFRQARAVIFVYSLTSSESINNIRNWDDSVSPERLEYAGVKGELIRVLCGNKSDLESKREVTIDCASTVAENYNIDEGLVFEISALHGDGFDDMFAEVVRAMKKTSTEQTSDTIALNADKTKKKDGGGCCSKK